MQRLALRRKLVRVGASLGAIAAVSAFTPAPAHASPSTCAALAAGAYRAVYNTTGSSFLAYQAAENQYWACRAVDFITR